MGRLRLPAKGVALGAALGLELRHFYVAMLRRFYVAALVLEPRHFYVAMLRRFYVAALVLELRRRRFPVLGVVGFPVVGRFRVPPIKLHRSALLTSTSGTMISSQVLQLRSSFSPILKIVVSVSPDQEILNNVQ